MPFSRLRDLSTPVRLLLVALVFVLAVILLWRSAMRQPQQVALLPTKDVELLEAAQAVLRRERIDASLVRTGRALALGVAADQRTDAESALARAGIRDRTLSVKQRRCPKPDGPFPGPGALKAHAACQQEQRIQQRLLSSNVVAADVSVTLQEGGFGRGDARTVSAWVYAPDAAFDPAQAATAIAGIAGTDVRHVTITDDRSRILFDGAEQDRREQRVQQLLARCLESQAPPTSLAAQMAHEDCIEGRVRRQLAQLHALDRRVEVLVNVGPAAPDPADGRQRQLTSIQVVLDAASFRARDITSIRAQLARWDSASCPLCRLSVRLDALSRPQPLELPDAAAPAPVRPERADAAGPPSFLLPVGTRHGWAVGAGVAMVTILVLVLLRRAQRAARRHQEQELLFEQERHLFEELARREPELLASHLTELFERPQRRPDRALHVVA